MKNWMPEPNGTAFVNYAHRGASEYAPEYQTGCLTWEVTEALLDFLKAHGIVELCPRACDVSAALVEK